MLTFYIIRHGQTEANRDKIVMGSKLDAPLTDEGKNNVKNVGEKLKGIKFDDFFCSDLGRTVASATIVSGVLGIDAKKTKELRELDIGEFTGWKNKDYHNRFPHYKNHLNEAFPGGESFDNLKKRAFDFIYSLEERYNDKTLLILSHVGIIRALVSYFNDFDYDEWINKRLGHEYIGKFVINKGKLVSYEQIN